MNIETLKVTLQNLVELVNSLSPENTITFNQQDETKENMSLTGGNGRLIVEPRKNAYDIGLSGKNIQIEMYDFMSELCGSRCTGYKQKNQKIGKCDLPFWRVSNFELVQKAVYHYAGINSESDLEIDFPDEIESAEQYVEGATKSVSVNTYERNSSARKKCLEHYGYKCIVCEFDFEKVYGLIGKNFIHVHHIVPLSEIKQEYILNPIKDLVPVCPNCHSMIHRVKPALKIEQLKEII